VASGGSSTPRQCSCYSGGAVTPSSSDKLGSSGPPVPQRAPPALLTKSCGGCPLPARRGDTSRRMPIGSPHLVQSTPFLCRTPVTTVGTVFSRREVERPDSGARSYPLMLEDEPAKSVMSANSMRISCVFPVYIVASSTPSTGRACTAVPGNATTYRASHVSP
jgi:hypothetical protein